MLTHYTIEWLLQEFENGGYLSFIYFWGHTNKYNTEAGKFCFSQWYDSPFTVDDTTYKTSEHWMMAQKALLFNDKISFDKIIDSASPKEAKKLGRQVLNYDELLWNKYKFNIVKQGNIHKFNQNPNFAKYLLETGNAVLVEASPVDTIWGIGLSENSKDIHDIYSWRGENLLGFVLMEVRDFLKSFNHFTSVDNVMQPPWKQFPDVESTDIFWRMGKGESYLMDFFTCYTALSEREKQVYGLTNPAPYSWVDFYD